MDAGKVFKTAGLDKLCKRIENNSRFAYWCTRKGLYLEEFTEHSSVDRQYSMILKLCVNTRYLGMWKRRFW